MFVFVDGHPLSVLARLFVSSFLGADNIFIFESVLVACFLVELVIFQQLFKKKILHETERFKFKPSPHR